MNAWIVIGIDGLLYLWSYVALSILLLILTRVIGRRKISIALFSAFFAIVLIQVINVFVQGQLGKFLPASLDMLKIGLAGLTSLMIVSQFVKWRLQASLVASVSSVLLVIVAHLCASIYTPILSRDLMPEGPRFAQIGSHTKSEVKRVVDEAIKKQEETGEFSLIAKLGQSFSGFKQITSKEESQSIGRDFKAGMDFIKERRALMASMTDEEKKSYRESVAQFKNEQSISNDPYSAESLARLKNVKGMEGVGSGLESAAHLKESGHLDMAGVAGLASGAMAGGQQSQGSSSMGSDNIDGIMGQLTAGLASSDGFDPSSGPSFAQAGSNLTPLGQLPGSSRSSALSGAGQISFTGATSATGPQGFTGPSGPQIQRPSQQNFMAKDSQPELNYYATSTPTANEAPIGQINTTENLEEMTPLELADTEIEEVVEEKLDIELVDQDSLIPAPTENAIFHLPEESELWDDWFDAAKALPLEGFFVGVGSETTTIVIIRNEAIPLGETSEIQKNGKTYSFRVDEVDEGIVQLSAVSRS
ncbi:MAG: hypothetical protein AAF546_08175 [Verrucomicrobiota bacterium]